MGPVDACPRVVEGLESLVMRRVIVVIGVLVVGLLSAQPALAGSSPGVEHLRLHAGPYQIIPGANQDLFEINGNRIPKPTQDGYITRFAPNLRYAKPDGSCCGGVPRVCAKTCNTVDPSGFVWL